MTNGEPELELVRVDNGEIVLTFLPGVGGRLLSIVVDGHEFLWRNPAFVDEELRFVIPRSQWPTIDDSFASWSNIGGSKTWPAPQGWGGEGEWPGPPDTILDAGAWTVETSRDETSGDHIVVMTSGDDHRSGLRIRREFVLPKTGTNFGQTTTFFNVSARLVTWSIWEVCQVDTSRGAGKGIEDAALSVALMPTNNEEEGWIDLGSYRGELMIERPNQNLAVLAVQDVVAKRGFPSASGTIGYRDAEGEITLDFAVDPAAEYPDGGSRAEIWMQSPQAHPIVELTGLHPDAYLAELEVLSPSFDIQPGANAVFRLDWTVRVGA